jgi:hypothetical protein
LPLVKGISELFLELLKKIRRRGVICRDRSAFALPGYSMSLGMTKRRNPCIPPNSVILPWIKNLTKNLRIRKR